MNYQKLKLNLKSWSIFVLVLMITISPIQKGHNTMLKRFLILKSMHMLAFIEYWAAEIHLELENRYWKYWE